MDPLEKTRILGDAGKYDSCGPKACEVNIHKGIGGIYHAKAENENCKLFKTLMNNSCSFDCKYCSNANKCTKNKAKYSPDELAKVFMFLRKEVQVHGLFLSSAVSGEPDKVSHEMIEAVRLLRYKYKFKGYVHFKVLPGTSYELVKQASELSTRMSINIEAPNKSAMNEMSSCKEYKTDILKRQSWISKMKLPGGQSTQVILNRFSSDKEILKMMDWEYENLKLRRMYFAAFRPIQGTDFEKEKAEPITRQNHLYNVDFLMRQYNFDFKEFSTIMDDGMLPNEDPKLALAKHERIRVDVNETNYNELIRVPGIGPKTAKKILEFRGKIKRYEELHKLGAFINKAKPFLNVDGKRQKMLFEF